MNEPTPYSGSLVLPADMRAAEVTIPGVQLWHYITDDQLTTLGELRKEPAMEIFLASFGAFLGAIAPAVEQLGRFNDRVNPMGYTGLFTVLVAVVALAIAIVTGLLWHKRGKHQVNLLNTIKSRKKVPVSTE